LYNSVSLIEIKQDICDVKVVLWISTGRINRLDADMSKASIVPALCVCLLLLWVFYVSDRKRSRARSVHDAGSVY